MLFNFYEASSLNVKGVIGSVLAPYATVSENWGQVNGNVIVDTWASTVQINANHYFTTVDVAAFTMVGKNPGATPPPTCRNRAAWRCCWPAWRRPPWYAAAAVKPEWKSGQGAHRAAPVGEHRARQHQAGAGQAGRHPLRRGI